MSNLMNRRDLAFLLYDWLDVESLCARPRFAEHSRETFDQLLELSEQIATDLFAPHNKLADQNEPKFVDGQVQMIPEVKQALDAYREAGLMAQTQDFAHGGLQLPHVVASAADMWFKAANVGTSAYPLLTKGALNMLLAHASPEQIARFAPHMVSGRFFGTMALSEPQAGSSLADIRTRAEPQADGTYRLFGTKMWISGGEHELSDNIVHFVLAKIPGGPAGVKGISLFITPKVLVNEDGSLGERNDVVLAGLNHKMGYRGTTNTLLNFGEGAYQPGGQPGAMGLLVGEPHKGLTYMFHMMNEARIGVGLGAVALGYTGYLKALDYARSRPQGRRLAERDPASPPVPIIQHADVRRMLLAQKSYVEGALALNLYCSKLVDETETAESDEARARASLLLEVLTPIAKSWPSQWCLEANSLAIQVHGGAGYTRDYDVEQHYRDNRLNPIHEGTHGVQGLDLLGRKVMMQEGAGLKLLLATAGMTVERGKAAGGDLADWAADLEAALQRLSRTTLKLAGVNDPELRLANASVFLEAFGHIVVAWIWLEQALAAQGGAGDFFDGKRQAARYFFSWELPKTSVQLDLLDRLDDTTLEMADAWF